MRFSLKRCALLLHIIFKVKTTHTHTHTHTHMAPGILYAVVARGNVILAEFSSVQGNASLVALQLLEKLDAASGARSTYTTADYSFHVLLADGLIYLAMADQVRAVATRYGSRDDV